MPRGRPRTFDTDDALDAALTLFWRHGYEGTSLAMLTDRLGLSAPSLYAAFGNKESLFEKVVDRYVQQQAGYVGRACRMPTARGVAESLLTNAIEMVMSADAINGCLLVHGALASGPQAEGVRRALARRRSAGEAAVRRRFERAVAEGDLPPGTPVADLACYLMTVIWGMSVQAAGGASRQTLRAVARAAMAAFPST
jgi:AcrR family transcriptional regulator